MSEASRVKPWLALSSEVFCTLDSRGIFMEVGGAWAALGYAAADLVGKSVLNFVQDVSHFRAEAMLQNNEDRVSALELNFKTGSGSFRTLHGKYRLDRPLGHIHLCLSSQKDSENELKKAKEFFGAILDNSPSVIYAKDLEGRFVFANKKFCDSLSLKQKEVVGKTNHELFPSEVADVFHSNDRKIANSRCSQNSEEDAPHPDGIHHYFSAKFPLINERGEVTAVCGISNDITELKKAQALLTQAAKMSILGEMAGGIAHEINNPLAIISGRVSNIRSRIQKGVFDGEKTIEELNKIESTTFRIARIVRGLKSFSRGSERDPMMAVTLSSIVDDTLELCKERFKNHGVELRVGEIPAVKLECRAAQISQVLLNFFGNAFDAVEGLSEKWVELNVEVKDGQVFFYVKDSGKGIPIDVASKMMNPFFTTKGVGKGTGLGLSISKGISEDHHGRLLYDSSSPHTRFALQIPLTQPNESLPSKAS